jgi:hypothetical protein
MNDETPIPLTWGDRICVGIFVLTALAYVGWQLEGGDPTPATSCENYPDAQSIAVCKASEVLQNQWLKASYGSRGCTP